MNLQAVLTLNASGFLSGINSSVAGLNRFLGATSALTVLQNSIKGAIGLGDRMDELGQRLGVSAGKAYILSEVFQRNGSDVGSMTANMEILSKTLAGVSETGEDATRVMAAMGLNGRELLAMPLDQRIEALARSFQRLGSQEEKVAAARLLFGRGGGSMLTVLGDPDLIRKTASALGTMPAILDRSAAKLGRMQDGFADLSNQSRIFGSTVADQISGPIFQLGAALGKLNTSGFADILGRNIGGIISGGTKLVDIIGRFPAVASAAAIAIEALYVKRILSSIGAMTLFRNANASAGASATATVPAIGAQTAAIAANTRATVANAAAKASVGRVSLLGGGAASRAPSAPVPASMQTMREGKPIFIPAGFSKAVAEAAPGLKAIAPAAGIAAVAMRGLRTAGAGLGRVAGGLLMGPGSLALAIGAPIAEQLGSWLGKKSSGVKDVSDEEAYATEQRGAAARNKRLESQNRINLVGILRSDVDKKAKDKIAEEQAKTELESAATPQAKRTILASRLSEQQTEATKQRAIVDDPTVSLEAAQAAAERWGEAMSKVEETKRAIADIDVSTSASSKEVADAREMWSLSQNVLSAQASGDKAATEAAEKRLRIAELISDLKTKGFSAEEAVTEAAKSADLELAARKGAKAAAQSRNQGAIARTDTADLVRIGGAFGSTPTPARALTPTLPPIALALGTRTGDRKVASQSPIARTPQSSQSPISNPQSPFQAPAMSLGTPKPLNQAPGASLAASASATRASEKHIAISENIFRNAQQQLDQMRQMVNAVRNFQPAWGES